MGKALKEFHSPGVLWVILFSAVIWIAHLYFSDFLISILIGAILFTLIAKILKPEHPRVRELTIIAKSLRHKPTAPSAPSDVSAELAPTEPDPEPDATTITDEEIDEVAEGSFFGKVLWG